MMAKSEIYLSVDIEADGPIPGPHSMLSYAGVAYTIEGEEVGHFTENLIELPGAVPDPDTMDWWSKQSPTVWETIRGNPQEPAESMARFAIWMKGLPGSLVFASHPACYDFLFTYWYMVRFVGESPFSFSGFDIKTAASVMLKIPYRSASKRSMPKRWFRGCPKHTHIPLDDARGQGILATNIIRESRE